VDERKNRTLMEIAKCLLQIKKLHNMYWDEAIRTSNYVLNRCYTNMVEGKIPYEAWDDKKPSVHHFRVFGCLAYAHVPKENKKKLDAKNEPCVFIRYSEESKAYKLYNPKNIIFEEEKVYGK